MNKILAWWVKRPLVFIYSQSILYMVVVEVILRFMGYRVDWLESPFMAAVKGAEGLVLIIGSFRMLADFIRDLGHPIYGNPKPKVILISSQSDIPIELPSNLSVMRPASGLFGILRSVTEWARQNRHTS